MSEEYTPTTDDIRDEYVAYLTMEPGEEFYGDAITAEEARARFDRWHAAELRKAKAVLLDRLEAAERERDAYKRAKSENDERFMLERDEARSRAEAAEAKIARIRDAVSGHPECDRYDEDDVISCGWKSAYASVVAALQESEGE